MRVRPGPGERIVGQVDGVKDREAARALMGASIVVAAERLPPPEAGSWYVRDLLGLPVLVEGREVGRVVEIFQAGPVDVLEIKAPGREGVFVPMVEANVVEVRPGEGVELTLAAWSGAE